MVRRLGTWVPRRWEEQEGVYLAGVREWEVLAEDGEKEMRR